MTRYRWDKDRGELYEVGSERHLELHYVQQDTIEPTLSHATAEGRVFESKSQLLRHYAENGYEVTGGVRSESERRRDAEEYRKRRREDIKHTIAEELRKNRWGMARLTEKEKAVCQREERQYQKWKREQGLE